MNDYLPLGDYTMQSGDGQYEALFRMEAGNRQWLTLCQSAGEDPEEIGAEKARDALRCVCRLWRDWVRRCSYESPQLVL
jgi:hypothetical protein